MPAPEPRPEPLARARARLEFDALIHRREVAFLDADRREDAELLASLAQAFADQVDRENSSRGILRTGTPVEYVDAVVLTGQAGALVVDAIEYDGAPVYWQAKAGDPDSVIRGRDLDGYLRTGEQRYAEQLGLPS
jgi:hypothetical protein